MNTGGARVLLAEDSPTQAVASRSILEGAGYSVVHAADGDAALRAIGEAPFDIVVSDVEMPLVDGYELCRRLRSNEATRHVPIVLLSSLSSRDDIVRGLESGADGYVSKADPPDILLGRMARLLKGRAG